MLKDPVNYKEGLPGVGLIIIDEVKINTKFNTGNCVDQTRNKYSTRKFFLEIDGII